MDLCTKGGICGGSSTLCCWGGLFLSFILFFFFLLCYCEWIVGVFCFGDRSFFSSPLKAIAPVCKANTSLELPGENSTPSGEAFWVCELCLVFMTGDIRNRHQTRSSGGEFFSKHCVACLIEIACVFTGRRMLVFFSGSVYFFFL